MLKHSSTARWSSRYQLMLQYEQYSASQEKQWNLVWENTLKTISCFNWTEANLEVVLSIGHLNRDICFLSVSFLSSWDVACIL